MFFNTFGSFAVRSFSVSSLTNTARVSAFALISTLAVVAGHDAHAAGTKAAAAAPQLSLEEIVEKSLNKGTVGFKQGTATLQMTITNNKGEVKANTILVKAMKSSDGTLRSMVKFTSPASVAGTAFLVREKKDALPDQYIYLPSTKRVTRVVAGQAGSSFFGSDFSFGDLMPLPLSEKDKVSIVRGDDAQVLGQDTYTITVTPKIAGAPYGKVVVSVDKQRLIPLKIDFFDPQLKALKTLKVKALKKVGGEEVPVHVVMESASGSKTELVIENPDANAKLSESDFTEEAMQR